MVCFALLNVVLDSGHGRQLHVARGVEITELTQYSYAYAVRGIFFTQLKEECNRLYKNG